VVVVVVVVGTSVLSLTSKKKAIVCVSTPCRFPVKEVAVVVVVVVVVVAVTLLTAIFAAIATLTTPPQMQRIKHNAVVI